MNKSQIKVMPDYYNRYIDLIKDIDLSEAFDESNLQLKSLDRALLKKLGHKTYAEGKWTANDIFQHLIDTERIMNYRMLLFAREDNAKTPGFEENMYAVNAGAIKRNIDDLIDELQTVRNSTTYLINSFDEDTLLKKGVSWNYEISVLGIGFMIVGHQIHHLKVIDEKYYPLVK